MVEEDVIIVQGKNKNKDSALEPGEETSQEGKMRPPVVVIAVTMKGCKGLHETLGLNRNSKTQMIFFFHKMNMPMLNKYTHQ